MKISTFWLLFCLLCALSHVTTGRRRLSRHRRKAIRTLQLKEKAPLESKLKDNSKPCTDAVYVTLGGTKKIDCYPNSAARQAMQELSVRYRYRFWPQAISTKVQHSWMMHSGIASNRVWVDRNSFFNIMNASTSDAGPITCHVSIIKEAQDSAHPEQKLKSFDFRKILLPKVYPRFSSAATLAYKVTTCDEASQEVT